MNRWVPNIRTSQLVSPDGYSTVSFSWYELPKGGNQMVTVTGLRGHGHAPTSSHTRGAARKIWAVLLLQGFTAA